MNNTSYFPTSRGVWAVLVLFLLAGIAVLDDYGVSWDEPSQRTIATLNADYISGKNDDLFSKPLNRSYGVAFELPLLLVERVLGLEDTRTSYLSRHLLIHLFFLLGGVCCYLLAMRLFNNRLLALAAMLLFLLHPRLYAHSFFNSKDIPFFSMFMVTLLLIHRAFARDTVRAFLLCGAAVAVLINLRVMGVMLLIAVVGMRGLDVWYASDRQERIRVLKTLVSFVGGGFLTLYAVWPYLWEDPLGRLVETITAASRFPHESPELFKGEFVRSTDLPWDYLPTWFLITTPWVVLLLGLAGMIVVGYRGLTQPRKIVRNTPLRFQCFLLACFILPILAVIVFNSVLYDGWRHMYFIYAPFCLLAAFGLYQLASLFRKKYWGIGVYALTGIGLIMVVIEMAQIHPYQNVYFNALVDRHTPGYLRTQYEMEYWGTSYKEGLEYLLERDPVSSSLYVHTGSHIFGSRQGSRNWMILPATDRQRIIFDNTRASFYLANNREYTRKGKKPDIFNSVYTRKVYNNTIFAIQGMDLDLLSAPAQALYRDAYQKVETGEPVIHSVFDVYRHDGKLVYIKESCTWSDVSKRFFLHVFPVYEVDLPDWRRPYGFDNLDFNFFMHGVRAGDKCIAIVPFPEYDIARIKTGLYSSKGRVWEARVEGHELLQKTE